MMTKATKSRIARVKRNISKFIAKQPVQPFGHGYLWGYVNGYKTLLASIDGRENWDKIEAKARSYEGVTTVWINID